MVSAWLCHFKMQWLPCVLGTAKLEKGHKNNIWGILTYLAHSHQHPKAIGTVDKCPRKTLEEIYQRLRVLQRYLHQAATHTLTDWVLGVLSTLNCSIHPKCPVQPSSHLKSTHPLQDNRMESQFRSQVRTDTELALGLSLPSRDGEDSGWRLMNALHPMKNPIVDGEIPVSIWYSKKTHQIGTIFSGWWLTYPSEKYEFVSWEDDIPKSRWKKKCSKPPTRWLWNILSGFIKYGWEIPINRAFNGENPPRCWWALGRSTRPWHKCFDDPPANASPPHTPGLRGWGTTWDPRKTPRPTTGFSSELGDDHIPSGYLT